MASPPPRVDRYHYQTLNAFCFELGAIAHRWDQGDRVLTEKYVDNDTGET